MKKRLIDIEELYFDGELAEALSPESDRDEVARGLHLYVILWGISEDWGGYKLDYKSIALQTGVLEIPKSEVKTFIDRLIAANKIISFTAQGKTMHYITNFHLHQTLKNPPMPKLPLPPWITVEEGHYSNRKFAIYHLNEGEMPNNENVTSEIKAFDTVIDSKDKKSDKESKVFEEDSIEYKLANYLLNLIRTHNPEFKQPNLQKWALDIDLLIRVDKKNPTDITAVMVWCQKDPFWYKNILSTAKFRKQYDQLYIKAGLGKGGTLGSGRAACSKCGGTDYKSLVADICDKCR